MSKEGSRSKSHHILHLREENPLNLDQIRGNSSPSKGGGDEERGPRLGFQNRRYLLFVTSRLFGVTSLSKKTFKGKPLVHVNLWKTYNREL